MDILPFAGMTRIRFYGSRDHPPLSRLARRPEEDATLGLPSPPDQRFHAAARQGTSVASTG